MINRRFAPKTKDLIFYKEDNQNKLKQKSPEFLMSERFSKDNFDHVAFRQKTDQINFRMQNTMKEIRFDKVSNNHNVANHYQYDKSPALSARKEKLQNLRQSIQSLQKIIERSREMLNESSILKNSKNTTSSQKHKIKSDSLDVKFNYSTKKVNLSKLSQIKKNINQSFQTDYLPSLDQDTNVTHRENLLLESTRKAQNTFSNKKDDFTINLENRSQNCTQIKTNSQLNLTLEKLLNQSFETSLNGKTILIDSANTTFQQKNLKWFNTNEVRGVKKQKNHHLQLQNFQLSNQIDQIKNSKLSYENKQNFLKKQVSGLNFQKRNGTNNQEIPSFSQIENNDNTFDEDRWIQAHTRQNIIIEDKETKSQDQNDIIEGQQDEGVHSIQNFFTNNRQSYHGEMKLHQSYLRNHNTKQQNKSVRKKNQQSPNFILKTPKAYQNYQQNTPSRTSSKNKSWIPKNFNDFEKKVLQGKFNQNVFKEESNQGKFSPRVIYQGKQNHQEVKTSKNIKKDINLEDIEKKRKFVNEVWKYPFVQRYLKEGDIYSIYEKLRRSKVPEQKWILFVIDQVHKKMKKVKQ